MAPKALSKKILSLILIASTIITTVLTCATLYIDYRSELNSLERSLDQLERMTINPLSLAIWSFDEPQIHIFMQGIVAISDFAEVSITDSSGTLMYHLKRESQKETNSWWQGIVTDYLESHSYPLKIKLKGEPQKLIGSLHVLVSKQRILNNLAKKLEVIFVAEAIKTILISLTILTIVHIYVTRHIFRIVQYLESYRRKNFKPDGPLKLIHHTGKADEIQSLATSLNALITELDKQFVSNSKRLVSTEQELEHQRMLSTQSARLASLGEMAGGIAHEINNPLAIIMASAQRITLELDHNNIEQAQRCSQQIIQTGDRIAHIINSMRKLSRDGKNSTFHMFSVTSLINEALCLSEEKMKQSNIKILRDIDENITLCANEIEISQVIFNLLSNSYDAVKDMDNPWIKISAHKQNKFLCLSIVDAGHGIPQEIAAKIMQPFFTSKEIGHGTGLGLSISLAIAKKHGGNLALDPKSPNTKFDLTIPLNIPA